MQWKSGTATASLPPPDLASGGSGNSNKNGVGTLALQNPLTQIWTALGQGVKARCRGKRPLEGCGLAVGLLDAAGGQA